MTSISTSWTGCPVFNTDSKRVAEIGTRGNAASIRIPPDRTRRGRSRSGRPADVRRCGCFASDPPRDRVVDPPDVAVLVDQQHADIHDVEDRLKLRLGGFQLRGALLDQFLEVMAVFLQLGFGLPSVR